MKKKPSFYFWLACTVLWMLVIFAFSAFDATQSEAQSVAVTRLIFGHIEYEAFIRVFSHFMTFAVLGVCGVNALKHFLAGKRLFFASLAFCSLYAITDEMHQMFVPGRAAQFSDWLIDTLGALAGIGAAWLVFSLRREKKSPMSE